MARPTPKADYGWLAESLWHRVHELKRYPHEARVKRMEGRVVLRVVINDEGHLKALDVVESSGHEVLDRDALEIIRQACPLKLKHPLGRPQVVVQVPINYRLDR
jgi:protein TonB